MNDFRGYSARLRSWAAGLRAVLFAAPAPRAGAPDRHEGCVLVLDGDDAVVGWLLRDLRAATVDRDARGRPCKERQARVLRRSPVAVDDDALEGEWREIAYGGGRAARDALVVTCIAGAADLADA